jgi:hypothetical protein
MDMEKYVFGCWGHAFNRKIFYTAKNGTFNECSLPGGAAFIQYLLSTKKLAGYSPLGSTYRCEYVELQQSEDRQNRKSRLLSRYLGFSKGSVTPAPCEADYAVIYDEGLGPVSLPAAGIPVLWASNKMLPGRDVFSQITGQCFLLLDVTVLRNSGVMISRKISWERSATELIWQLQNNALLSHLHKASHILVTFAEDGAVYIRMEKGQPKASLILAHGDCECFLREKNSGLTDDTFTLMTATVALQLPEVMAGTAPLRVLPVLKAAKELLTEELPLEKLAGGKFELPEIETDVAETSFEIPFNAGQSAIDPGFWCISNSVGNRRIFDIAFDYVLKGTEVIEGLPRLSYGALTTIDRREMESFRNVCNLIDGYVHSNSIRPLSIAVFGAPGSGKSFGVTQIAKNILPGKVEKLEFNVSQFTDSTDLGIAFQKVRDVTLEGKLPLVFFDEFDSDRNGIQLGWVKNFLMPMQDGKFRDENDEHPLGKCILVFAGGTSASFEEFSSPILSEDAGKRKKFKDIKGPDFVSRLRGTINVLGPNQTGVNDKNYILRRALLLRSLCERKLKIKSGKDAPISKNVLWAMLLVPEYKHGARSMEAILDMSRLEGNVWEPASLPFYSQLSLHVDADAFIKLILREVMLNSYNEKLAGAIHENYRKEMIADGKGSHPSVVSWEKLPEEFKESNRNQARDIVGKLNSVGFEYDSGDAPSIEQFDRETLILLSQREHLRWWNEKLANGWLFMSLDEGLEMAKKRISQEEWDALDSSQKKNAAIKAMREKKQSHLLIEWDRLEKEEQDKDIRMVENIIPLLKSIGLRVYKII